MVKVGILGLGQSESLLLKYFKRIKTIIEARAGKKIVPTIGLVRDLNRDYGVDIPLTDKAEDVINSKDIDIIVEVIGGIETPYKFVKKALENGKAVVTANKALLAYHRYELQNIAKDTPLFYEASVAGGIPVIGALRNGLSANHINSIMSRQ